MRYLSWYAAGIPDPLTVYSLGTVYSLIVAMAVNAWAIFITIFVTTWLSFYKFYS